ncbi:MAG TPA: response regulator transcription factor [Acidimicrobiales bacterium]|nr:response regulator transcription factor [Acidimicrobiales bacterium]
MGERILVIDDEADIARVLELTLEDAGYEVRVANGSREGLQTALEFRPDLVLLDISMPEMDGLQVTRALRADAVTSSTSIILVTAKASMDDRVVGLAAGADDYVVKPFDIDELLSRINAALRRGRQLRGVSPLTGLPGNFDILRQLEDLLHADGPSFALAHADLDNFKAYNDHYGFVRGDQAIQATAELLLTELGKVLTRPRFLGHVGGDDFALLLPAAVAEEVAEAIVEGFSALLPRLYEPADLVRGVVVVTTRDGKTRDVPLLGISLGLATTAHRPFGSAVEMAAVATEMKQFAKHQVGSTWRIDRRRGDRSPPPV